jgi:hypothetical protein
MSILKRSYEISVWEDIFNADTNKFEESRVAVIGSDTMSASCRAMSPKLKRKGDGTNELSFKLYSYYRDEVTNEKLPNPFIDYITNESKIKLKYKGRWYDLLVKNISQDRSNHSYSFTATDMHIIELSKNGFGLELDTSLMNNTGTAKELGERILADTDWIVESDKLVERQEERLVKMLRPNGETAYVFYSCLKNSPSIF